MRERRLEPKVYTKEFYKYMYGLKELLTKEEARLYTIKQIVDDRLVNVPEGSLRITSTRNRVQFMHCIDKNNKSKEQGIYIKQEDISLAHRLAQKTYDHRVKKIVDRRLKQIESLNKEYMDNEIDELYNSLHPMRKTLIKAVETPWEQRLLDWKNTPYVGKEFAENIPVIYSKKGERVRSKSEKILADIFFDLGIEYKYECPLKLKGFGIVYPDFTILRKRDRKEIYWEHDGRMDDPKYAEKAVRKINSYIANGILPGDKLIISYETSGVVLDDRIIKMLIEKYVF
ncbi:hypothetical protein [Butyrivibrio sp. VCD2006]|uniref:hypothetical protein n=1 Tax=Butyrivibrio sp. VCD2006 TaxID=1280664 RepID=UPI001FA79912|nr:hypothetical protein [Butyrivibrio sp. VCD2006]